jgi:hypothetical protein
MSAPCPTLAEKAFSLAAMNSGGRSVRGSAAFAPRSIVRLAAGMLYR